MDRHDGRHIWRLAQHKREGLGMALLYHLLRLLCLYQLHF